MCKLKILDKYEGIHLYIVMIKTTTLKVKSVTNEEILLTLIIPAKRYARLVN